MANYGRRDKVKFCDIDFEFFNSNEKDLHLVCCSLQFGETVQEHWLNDGQANRKLRMILNILNKKGYIFRAYAVEAEARSMMALHLPVTEFKFIDLYLEWRMLTNHNDKLSYGKQLIDGRVRNTFKPKPKWKRTEQDERNEVKQDHSKVQHSLASCAYKLLGVKIDTEFKDATRDIILSKDLEYIEENKKQIMDYCTSDIQYLSQIYDRMLDEYKRLLSNDYNEPELITEMLRRGSYSARTALMVSEGYPINRVATKAFSHQVPDLIWELQSEINSLFPDILPFRKNRNFTYSWNQTVTKEWVRENHDVSKWIKTDKKDVSLSLKAFKKFYNYSHDYPEDSFGAQIVRYLSFVQQMNGFRSSKKRTFWDSVGEKDDRVRPYFGIYGAQSSRSQPKATGFLFLKSAWMRALCQPEKGRAVVGIDYGSQEFLLGAILSKDIAMVNAYNSGDPYLYFAKLAGAVPWEGKKEDYKEERNLFKATTLGVSYGMGKHLLASKITEDTGNKCTVEEADRLIRKFEKAYPKYNRYRRKVIYTYRKDGFLKLPCGWIMFGDNDNEKSTQNFTVQGFGASIMRKAVEFAQEAGLKVIMTLHDAVYIEIDSGDWGAVGLLSQCMQDAFTHYFTDEKSKKFAKLIRLDANAWGPDLKEGYECDTKTQKIYVDERGEKQYNKFKKYFEPIDYSVDI